jgi:mRNA interferase RelE/StbE
MTYRVWIKDEAKAEASALPGNVKQRVRHAILELGEDPRPSGSLEMRAAHDSDSDRH